MPRPMTQRYFNPPRSLLTMDACMAALSTAIADVTTQEHDSALIKSRMDSPPPFGANIQAVIEPIRTYAHTPQPPARKSLLHWDCSNR